MNFEALFKPRIRPTLLSRINWILGKFQDADEAVLEPAELVRALGHAQSPHGIELRQLLVQTDGKYMYKLDKGAIKKLVLMIRDRDNFSSSVAETVRRDLVYATLELGAAEERLTTLRNSHAQHTPDEFYLGVADVAMIKETINELSTCARLNATKGATVALEYRDALKSRFLSNGTPLLEHRETLSVS